MEIISNHRWNEIDDNVIVNIHLTCVDKLLL